MITPRWVLTAAHCLWGHSGAQACGDPEGVFVETKPGWIPSGWPDSGDVTLVEPDLNPAPVVREMESIGGNLDACSENSRSRDWALLRLDRRVAFSETNRFHPPVILQRRTCELGDEFRGVIVGYGRTGFFGGSGGVRHFSFEDDWERDPTDTGAEYESVWEIPAPGPTPETQFLAFLASVDPIYDGMNPGDSGGPLLQVDGNNTPIALCGVASSPFVHLIQFIKIDLGNSYAAVDAQEAWQFIEARILGNFPENPKIDGWYEGECRAPNENADVDEDEDGIPDACDNCPPNNEFKPAVNPDQANFDFANDEIGDACDDSDGDGLLDGDELNVYGTDPLNPDSDGDGLTDGAEVFQHMTDPLDSDTDDDGLTDGEEVNLHMTDPLDSDTDDDGLLDGEEVNLHMTDPLDPDTDDDGLLDGEEVHMYGTDPLDPDTDDDRLLDGEEVHVYGTDPLDPDTDDDELIDGLEVMYGTDPLNPDTDGDGLLDGEDVEFVQNGVNGLPLSAIIPPGQGTRNAILVHLDGIEDLLLAGHRAAAILRLNNLRARLDGCGATPDTNDWVVTCPEQLEIRELVDVLIANLAN
jgi:hypothetical protein